MTVLIVGGGGREHALAWKLAGSTRVTDLFCAPGNPGIGELADLVPIAGHRFGRNREIRPRITQSIWSSSGRKIRWPWVWPIGCARRGSMVFGPSKAAAQIEADKWFAKEIMRHQAIPTAEARSFTDPAAAEEFVKTRDEPVVIKAAGLAKGKGVTICYRTGRCAGSHRRDHAAKAFRRGRQTDRHRGNACRPGMFGAGFGRQATRSTCWSRPRTTRPLTTATPAR